MLGNNVYEEREEAEGQQCREPVSRRSLRAYRERKGKSPAKTMNTDFVCPKDRFGKSKYIEFAALLNSGPIQAHP